MPKMISASIMCGDALNLGQSIAALRDSGVEYLHCDIMDGHFVPNLMLSTEQVKAFKAHGQMKLDIHMMVNFPENMLAWFQMGPGDIVSIHYESTPHVQRVLDLIKKTGATPALAINPSTPLECVRELLPDIGMLLIMTVNPGFAAQKLVPQTLDKVSRARRMMDDLGYPDILIEVDGNCSYENLPRMSKAGADLFVLGSSSIFGEADIGKGVQKARELITNI